jgi:dolichol-phosphate mannosyltransferase
MDATAERAAACGARVIRPSGGGYGHALREGLAACSGNWVLTLDADLSHDPAVVMDLLSQRQAADIVVASRYVMFGHACMPFWRRVASRLLNATYRGILGLPLRDVTSGYRLYRASVLREAQPVSLGLDILPETVVHAYANGYRVKEIPFHYRPRAGGRSQFWRVTFGWSYLRTLVRCWFIRNSIRSADYDFRAFHSRHPVQRYWQRRRYAIVTGFIERYQRGVDIGCGSSVILDSLPGVVGADYSAKKLRFMGGHLRNPLVRCDVRRMPFATGSLDLLVCSQVIEHVPFDPGIFDEFQRVLQPGGTLVLGTPDYATVSWRVIEWLYRRLAPGAYGDEHIARYTLRSLTALLDEHGFDSRQHAYVGGGELIVKACRR